MGRGASRNRERTPHQTRTVMTNLHIPKRLRVGHGNRGRSDRGSGNTGWQRRIDLGPVCHASGHNQKWRYAGGCLRSLSPLRSRFRSARATRYQALPPVDRLATRVPGGRRSHQHARTRLLLAVDRCPIITWHHSMGHALPLGPASGPGRAGGLARATHRRRLRPLCRRGRQEARRSRHALVHRQRDPLFHRQWIWQRLFRAGPAA